jgi:hypothetical protein
MVTGAATEVQRNSGHPRLQLVVQKPGRVDTARGGHRDVSFRSTVRGLPKDHAVAALHVCATPITGPVGTPPCRT